MSNDIAKAERCMFWHENQCAIKTSNPKKAWDIDHIINEICRVPENSHHVPEPMQPTSVYGIEVEKLGEYVKDLKARAAQMTESYTLRGVTRRRKQSIIKPILMVGIASYPEPEMRDTADRRRWIGLVIDAVKARVEADGGRLVAAVLHQDESFAHLHLASEKFGAPTRNLNWGFVASDAEPIKSNKGKAFRVGASRIQDWFFESVGSKMSWLRNRPEGERMPRMTPSQNNRVRQKKLEDKAAVIEAENLRLIQKQHRIDELELMALEQRAKAAADWKTRRDDLDAFEACLKSDKVTIAAIAKRLKSHEQRQASKQAGIDKQWEIFCQRVEQLKGWEQTIRTREEKIKELETLIQDQFSWEQHRLSGMVPKPSPFRSSNRSSDDDLNDVPF